MATTRAFYELCNKKLYILEIVSGVHKCLHESQSRWLVCPNKFQNRFLYI